MANSKKNSKIDEDAFLRNRAKRKASSRKSSKKKKDVHSFKWVLYAILISIGLALFAGILWGALWLIDAFFGAPEPSKGPDPVPLEDVALTDDGKKLYSTFLATATDASEMLTDVIMVARFNNEDPEVSILQIPRDTYVRISSNKLILDDDGRLSRDNFVSPTANYSVKINEVYNRGKNLAKDKITSLLKASVGKSEAELEQLISDKEYVFIGADIEKLKKYSDADDAEKKKIDKEIRRDFGIKYLQALIYYDFGIPTDYYAQVNIKGFRGIVDAIGGVDLYVPQNMDYEDEYQDLYIHLKKGQQTLNGEKAEQFVRYRGYGAGDIARLDAQKLFINAFLDKLLSVSSIRNIDDIMVEVQKNLYTDISLKNLINFGSKSITMDFGTDFSIQTLPGIGEYIGDASFFVTDKAETMKLVNEKFNVFNDKLIEEDFAIIASEKIYRPVIIYDDDEEDDDDDNDDPESDNENEDGENTESDDDDMKSDEDDDTESNDDNEDSESDDGESAATATSSGANLELLEQMLNDNQQ